MDIFTIGFTQKTAAEFFESLKRAKIKKLVDVRLNNTSQLAAFAKKNDLEYFLRVICDIAYVHEPLLAPTQDMLDAYKKGGGDWERYSKEFRGLLKERDIAKELPRSLFDEPTVLLCSEHSANHCHRRLVAEYLCNEWRDGVVTHL